MKNRPLSLLVACLLASALPGMAQEKPAANALDPVATATPSPVKVDADKVADSPKNPTADVPSPVTATTAESEAAANVAAPSPSPAGTPEPEMTPPPKDADYLPEPTDASLGAPVEPLPADNGAPGDVPNPDGLIPPGNSDATASDNEPPAPPKLAENQYDKDRKLAVQYQEVKLTALKDAAVRSLHDQSDAAKTDEGRRQALRAYYRALFAKMTSLDPTLKKKCDAMEEAYLRRLGQYRVAPTIPLHPPPTPEPLER